MNAAETLAAVREAGISLRAAPDGVSIIAAPSSRLTDPLRAAIRTNKPQLIAALNSAVCRVEVIELPQAQRYRKVFAHLQLKPPALVPVERWQQCVEDGSRFLAAWGSQAEALGWSSADLFGLHQPPERPHPSYQRLSRYDCTGLCWALQGRDVIAAAEGAVIRTATGATLTFYRHGRPALGPLGDDLGDLG